MSIRWKITLMIVLAAAILLTVQMTIWDESVQWKQTSDWQQKMIDVAEDLAAAYRYAGSSAAIPIEHIATVKQKDNPEFIDIGVFSSMEESQAAKEQNTAQPKVLFESSAFITGSDDRDNMAKALASDSIVSVRTVSEKKQIIKSYIPVDGYPGLVIGIVTDQLILKQELLWPLNRYAALSAAILLIVAALAYPVAGFMLKPLDRISQKVGEIAAGRFGAELRLRRKDELGTLAVRINSMSSSLKAYTERLEQTVEELRNTKEYLESIVSHSSDAIHVVDLEGNVLMANKAFESLFGWSREEVTGRPPRIFPPEGEAGMRQLYDKVIMGGQVAGFETALRTKDGRPIDASVTISPIRKGIDGIVALSVISRNITERKQTEELLRRSEKLSVVGQLAAGVAHEIRNPLTTLRGFVQLQKIKKSGNDEHVDLMLSELDRINFIVSEFLILAKPQATRYQQKDLAAILHDILFLLKTEANLSDIVFDEQFDQDLPLVKCEENQLKQVFINVLKNAMESMPDGGTVVVELRNIDSHRLMVRILDQGCGIPEDHLARLGEPFFTSKQNGNGLGIMVSQQIIANHHGTMLIRSELGKGTCVDIVLPTRF